MQVQSFIASNLHMPSFNIVTEALLNIARNTAHFTLTLHAHVCD